MPARLLGGGHDRRDQRLGAPGVAAGETDPGDRDIRVRAEQPRAPRRSADARQQLLAAIRKRVGGLILPKQRSRQGEQAGAARYLGRGVRLLRRAYPRSRASAAASGEPASSSAQPSVASAQAAHSRLPISWASSDASRPLASARS